MKKCKVTFDKASLKLAINFLLDQYFFSVGNSFLHQFIGIPMGLIYPPSWETSFFIVMKSGAFFLLRKKAQLRILTGKKHPQVKLQHIRKILIWAFGSLVYKSTLYKRFLKCNKIFQKVKQLLVKLRSSRFRSFRSLRFLTHHSIS